MNCNDCYNSTKPTNPAGYKGHAMVATDSGVIIYGGATWRETDLSSTDTIEYAKEKFLEKCRSIMEYRTIIEQANAAA